MCFVYYFRTLHGLFSGVCFMHRVMHFFLLSHFYRHCCVFACVLYSCRQMLAYWKCKCYNRHVCVCIGLLSYFSEFGVFFSAVRCCMCCMMVIKRMGISRVCKKILCLECNKFSITASSEIKLEIRYLNWRSSTFWSIWMCVCVCSFTDMWHDFVSMNLPYFNVSFFVSTDVTYECK